ncbi:Transposase, Tn3, partial [mine drainage metagenome]
MSPLDAVDEPASLAKLRSSVEALLPEVEIADVPLEVHGWTGFLDEFTHISGTQGRASNLIESVSALLVSEACNVGLTPVSDESHPPLSRDRLNWVAQNYLRSATLAAANTRLVDYHARLALANAWGGGEMASADGMRFVIPVSTIHAAYQPPLFRSPSGAPRST